MDPQTRRYLLNLAARYYRDCVERRVEFIFGTFSEHPEHFTKSFEPYLLNTALYYWNSRTMDVKEKREEIDGDGNVRISFVAARKENPQFIAIPALDRLCEELHIRHFIEKLKAKYQKQKFDPILYNIFKSAIKKRTNWIKDLEMFSKNGYERLKWLSAWGANLLANVKTIESARHLLEQIHADDSLAVSDFFEGVAPPEMPKVDKTKNRRQRRAEMNEQRKAEREAKRAAKMEARKKREEAAMTTAQ